MRIDGNDINEARDEALEHARSYGDDKLYLDEVESVIEVLITALTKKGI